MDYQDELLLRARASGLLFGERNGRPPASEEAAELVLRIAPPLDDLGRGIAASARSELECALVGGAHDQLLADALETAIKSLTQREALGWYLESLEVNNGHVSTFWNKGLGAGLPRRVNARIEGFVLHVARIIVARLKGD